MKRFQAISPWRYVGNKLALALSIMLLCGTVYAQRGRGTVLGAVTDASGAVVPGVTVIVAPGITVLLVSVTAPSTVPRPRCA